MGEWVSSKDGWMYDIARSERLFYSHQSARLPACSSSSCTSITSMHMWVAERLGMACPHALVSGGAYAAAKTQDEYPFHEPGQPGAAPRGRHSLPMMPQVSGQAQGRWAGEQATIFKPCWTEPS